jgi:hypothetical protein
MATIPSTQKFHTVEASVDTVEYGSSQLAGGREVYTMQDIIDTVGGGGGSLPYKLYTAKFTKGVAGSLTVTEISNDTGYTFDWVVNGTSLNIASSGVLEDSVAGIYSTYSLPTEGILNYQQTTSIKQAYINSSSITIAAVTLNMSTGVYNQSSTYGGIFELRVYGINI